MRYKFITKGSLTGRMKKAVKTYKSAVLPRDFEDGVWGALGENNPSSAARAAKVVFSKAALFTAAAAAAAIIFLIMALPVFLNKKPPLAAVNSGDKEKLIISNSAGNEQIKSLKIKVAAAGKVNKPVIVQAGNQQAGGTGTQAENAVEHHRAQAYSAAGQRYLSPAVSEKHPGVNPAQAAAAGAMAGASGITKSGPGGEQMSGDISVVNNVIHPSNGEAAEIRYRVIKSCNVLVIIYDRNGRVVRRISDGAKQPGDYTEYWKGDAESGSMAAAGIYILRVKTGSYDKTEKLGVIR
jgi:hypothetical protein